MNLKRFMSAAVLLTFLSFRGAAFAANDEAAVWLAKVGYESHYVTEGRDNLNGNPLWTGSLEYTQGPLGLGVWFGQSPQADYDELNAGGSWSVPVGPVAVTAGFTYLRFPADDAQDAELSVAAETDKLPGGLSGTLGAVYSAEAKGVFLEGMLAREFETRWRGVTVCPFVSAGWNAGYVPDGHRGMNHVAFGVAGSAPLGRCLRLAAHVACSCAVNADPERYPGDETLRDVLHAGVAVEAGF